MAFLTNQDVKIYYEVHGSGPTILLSHGYSATSQMWQGQTTAFEGYQVIRWDMRGHGKSDSPDDPSLYSTELTISDMQAILDRCNVEKAVIGGLSLGGYMSTKIPNATKVVIEGAGHASNIDKPEEFNSSVLDFLNIVAAAN